MPAVPDVTPTPIAPVVAKSAAAPPASRSAFLETPKVDFPERFGDESPTSENEPTLLMMRPPESSPSPPIDDDSPVVEAHEIQLPPRSRRSVEATEGDDAMTPSQRSGGPSTRRRLVSLTLLDGTTLRLPARSSRPPSSSSTPDTVVGVGDGEEELPPREGGEDSLTVRDLLAALRAVSHGADASEILGSNARWEAMFAALLSLLLKKHLISEWEFIEELKKI